MSEVGGRSDCGGQGVVGRGDIDDGVTGGHGRAELQHPNNKSLLVLRMSRGQIVVRDEKCRFGLYLAIGRQVVCLFGALLCENADG